MRKKNSVISKEGLRPPGNLEEKFERGESVWTILRQRIGEWEWIFHPGRSKPLIRKPPGEGLPDRPSSKLGSWIVWICWRTNE